MNTPRHVIPSTPVFTLLIGLLGTTNLEAQDRERIQPTHADVRYGVHERNVLDLYLPESDGDPLPIVLYIHGGGFRQGDKRSVRQDQLRSFLDKGWAVAALNYRLTDTAPAPAAYLDCARAIQFLRYHAEKWNLDRELIASTGGSAGAGTSLWIAFHDDLADPNHSDPIARQSTRLVCVVVHNGQSSYDPRFAEKIGIPRPNFERHPFFHPFYDIEKDEIDTPKAYRRYEQAAPITYLTKDDPPVMLTYSFRNEEVTSNTSLGLIVHHPKFGIALKERMDALGIRCIVQHRANQGNDVVQLGGNRDAHLTPTEFIAQQFDNTRR